MPRYARVVFLIVVLCMANAPAPTTASRAQSEATPPASASPVPPVDIALLLPTEQEVPPGLVMTDDRERSLDEVTANFVDPARARQQFVSWGWQRNLIRAFHTSPGASIEPDTIDGIYVSIHEFGSSGAAASALRYSFDVQSADVSLKEILIDPLGDASRALYGQMSYGNEITLYVQQGDLVIRLSASSPAGDPRSQALDLMETMLAR